MSESLLSNKMLKTEEESVMKASPEEEGRIIAQSRFDVNEEIRLKCNCTCERKDFHPHGLILQSVMGAIPLQFILSLVQIVIESIRCLGIGAKDGRKYGRCLGWIGRSSFRMENGLICGATAMKRQFARRL